MLLRKRKRFELITSDAFRSILLKSGLPKQDLVYAEFIFASLDAAFMFAQKDMILIRKKMRPAVVALKDNDYDTILFKNGSFPIFYPSVFENFPDNLFL
jgi:hypothetical protein